MNELGTCDYCDCILSIEEQNDGWKDGEYDSLCFNCYQGLTDY